MSSQPQDEANRDWHITLLENTPDVITRWDKDLKLLYANRALEAVMGIPNSSLLGKNNREMGQLDEVTLLFMEILRKVFETGETIEHFNSFPTPQGIAYFHSWMVPEKNERSEVETVFVITRDITELKRDQDELKKSEETLRETQSVAEQSEQRLQSINESLEQKIAEKIIEAHRLSADLIKAVQRERQRISHVLHDDLQQRIYAIRMQLDFLRDRLSSEDHSLQKELTDIESSLHDMLRITRDLSVELSPPILPGEGLTHAIDWLAGKMHEQYRLSVELQADGSFVISDAELHVLLFNCVRELLFNVVKHGGTNRAGVSLEWVNGSLRIEVRDNGKGFSVKASKAQSTNADSRPSLGLVTIRHQLGLFRGQMEIHSKPGEGTQVILTVPAHETDQVHGG